MSMTQAFSTERYCHPGNIERYSFFRVNRMTVSDDEIRQAIQSYVHRDPNITDSARSANISSLETFISSQEKSVRQMEARSQAPVTFELEDRLTHRFVHHIAQLRHWILEINDGIYAIQLAHLRKLVPLARQICDYVCNTPYTIGDFKGLEGAVRRGITSDREYLELRMHRKRLVTKAHAIIRRNLRNDLLPLLQTQVVAAVALYDPQVNYSRPCGFDEVLEEYIRCRPDLTILVEPAATVVAEGTPMAILSTLSEFNLAIMGCLKISSGPARAVVYTSLVRFLFAVGYTLNPVQLNGSDVENLAFLNACDSFSDQTVRDLVLNKVITQNYTPGLSVASLFRSKQVDMLKPMESMTNPIDLMHYVHEILGTLATYFASNEQFLSFDDTLTLLLALMSLSPPTNAIAIAAFVTKWDSVQLSSVVSIAKNYFVAAVEQILAYGQAHPRVDSP
jgi:hypothetical protein